MSKSRYAFPLFCAFWAWTSANILSYSHIGRQPNPQSCLQLAWPVDFPSLQPAWLSAPFLECGNRAECQIYPNWQGPPWVTLQKCNCLWISTLLNPIACVYAIVLVQVAPELLQSNLPVAISVLAVCTDISKIACLSFRTDCIKVTRSRTPLSQIAVTRKECLNMSRCYYT